VPDPHGSSLDQATRPRGGAQPPPTIMNGYRQRTPQAAHGHCRARTMTRLPLNVVIVDNDRGDSPSSYRARALRGGAQEVSRDTA
jgi:hypothetical protein